MPIIEFDLRAARYREESEQHINNFLRNIQSLSQAEDTGISMWETQPLLYNNLKPEALMEIPATQEHSKSER